MNAHRPKPLMRHLNNLYKFVSHPYSFLFVLASIVGWFIFGYMFHFDESWYKWFHVYEMIITLVMVFLIENSTHADNRAMQEKLDELIRALPKANDDKIGLEKELKGEDLEF